MNALTIDVGLGERDATDAARQATRQSPAIHLKPGIGTESTRGGVRGNKCLSAHPAHASAAISWIISRCGGGEMRDLGWYCNMAIGNSPRDPRTLMAMLKSPSHAQHTYPSSSLTQTQAPTQLYLKARTLIINHIFPSILDPFPSCAFPVTPIEPSSRTNRKAGML